MIFTDTINGVDLEIEDGLVNSIRDLAIASYSNELGGFLIGNYSSDMKRAVVKEMIVPEKFISTPVSFQRDTVGMNKVWEELFDNGLIYLGEWHSHPNGTASYSNTDKRALINIAECDSVTIANPIMIIFSLNKDEIKEVKAYYYMNGEIVEYE